MAGHVDGVLLVSSHSGDRAAEQLREAGVPLVQCGKPTGLGSKVSHVAADDRDGVRDMVRHLLSRGRRRIGMVRGPLDTPRGVDRLAGYTEVLTEAGVEIDMAQGALTALRRAGRRVPEDVSVGRFDDSVAATEATADLTTIRQPYDRISSAPPVRPRRPPTRQPVRIGEAGSPSPALA